MNQEISRIKKPFWVNTQKLMEHTGISRSSLERLRKRVENPLPHVQIGRVVTYDQNEVDEWLKSQETK